MLPPADGDVLRRLGRHAVVEDARREVQAKLAVLQVEAPAHLALVAAGRARDDHAVPGRGIHPRREAERVVVADVRRVPGVDEAPPVEARGVAQDAGIELRQPVLEHRRHVRRRLDAVDGALEGVVREQPVAEVPVDRPRPLERRLPLGPGRRRLGVEGGQRRPRLGELGVELVELGVLLAGRGGDQGRAVHVLEALAPLGDVVEVRHDLVELLLRDRVELVVVAARAAQGQAHPHRAGGRHAVDAVLGEELVDDDAPLAVQAVVAVERGGDALLQGRAGEHVAGELLDREPVERHVGVVGVDDPVAPAPHRPLAVGLVAVGVGVAGGVEPLDGHALAVARRREQPVDGVLVGVGGVVVQEVGELDRGRGHAGEVEGGAAQQGCAVGLVGRGQALGLETPQHEVVDVVARPLGVGDRGHGGALGGDERPVRLPLRALVDPQAEGLDLGLVEGLAAAGHPHPRVVDRHAVHEQAGRRVSRDDGGAAVAAAVGERPLGHVEPQAGLARRLVGPVAREAVLREQRPHLAGEVDGAPGRRRRGRARRRGVGAQVRALVDPRPHEPDLIGRERPPRRGRGHEADGLLRRQPLEERAAVGVAGPHVGLDEVGGVEPQLGLPGGLGRPVAREARLGEHRPHVAVELDPLGRLGQNDLRTPVRVEPRRHRRRAQHRQHPQNGHPHSISRKGW